MFFTKSEEFEGRYLICPKCQKALPYKTENRCSTCGGELEDLKGFYERRPELKDKL